ncbi:MAG TPA: hypothetical protein PK760_14875 [Flavobacteriales bacterium]|nr:hypothetical protein [Flavobacteriales bacterium]
MKRTIVVLCVAVCTIVGKAQSSGFGLGIMVGEPTGISAKYWLRDDRAIAGGLAWGLWRGGYFHLHGDYLFHNMSLFNVSKGKLALYYGPGLRIRSWTGDRYWRHNEWHDGGRTDIGVRFPVGLNYMFDGAPVDVFTELVPILDLAPETRLDFNAAIGVRYWF